MKLPQHTTRRRGSAAIYYRRRVPEDIQAIIGREEFMESLWTTEVEVAKTKAAFRNAEVEALFQQAKLTLKHQASSFLIEPPTADEQNYIRDAVRAHVLEEDEDVRLAKPDEISMEVYEDSRAEEAQVAAAGLRSGHVAWTKKDRERISKLLNAVGVKVEPGTPAWELAAYRANQGLHGALRDIAGRIHGEYVNTPERPTPPPSLAQDGSAQEVVTLGDAIDHYLGGLPENDFRRKVRRCLQLFGTMMGRETEVSDLRQLAVTDFMRDICRLPDKWARRADAGESIAAMLASPAEKVMSPSTYEANYRGPLGTFLVVASANFGEKGFPVLNVKHIKYLGNRKPEEDKQRPLTDPELVTLFESKEFKRIAAEPEQEPLYWLLVVMLFTGARPREVCQLNPQVDFGELNGHWFIDLDEYSAAGVGIKKSIKTGETRRLPLHAELMRLGFPQYLQRVKDSGGDRLFPSWRIKGGNPVSAHYGLVAGLLKAVGLYTRNAPPGEQVTGAYVLRKTFITQCRNQGVISKEITGHSDERTTRMQDKHYIKGFEPLSRKLDQLSKLVMAVRVPLPTHGSTRARV